MSNEKIVLKILVACEESQAVTKEFRRLGHEAFSCDILPCSGGHPEWHIQGDAIKALHSQKWDLVIAHPPCTYLCVAGLHYSKKSTDRMALTIEASDFFMEIYDHCDVVAIENPVGYMNSHFRKPDQIIEPYHFGHAERKKTCLWLKGLPKLIHETNLEVKPIKTIIRKTGSKAGQPYNYYWRQGKSAKERSKTFPGIAKAMAEQWSEYLLNTTNP